MSSKAVLILEDAVFIREMEKKFLRNNNFEIKGETNSEDQGVALYEKTRPDLVIVDLQLAQGDGKSAIARIKKIDANARVLVITSYGEHLEEDKELRDSISAVLLKPFTEEEFIKTINGIL